MHTILDVSPEWDPDKAASNLRKHGVDFADAVGVLEDPRAVTIPDDAADEERYVTVGMDLLGRVLVVCWTWRNDDVRLISARKADAHERHAYEEG
ncbi:MAG TPA: BrnT family toxin [Burkholderiales bacterium]|nr:BrnT family toxin [Burkholderiales bacterium]